MAEPARRRLRRAGIALGLLGLVLALGVVAREVREMRRWVRTDDAFVEGPMVLISARVPGQVVEVTVREHERVHRGDLLVHLDPSDYEAKVAEAKAALAAARNRMRAAEAAAAAADAERKAAEVELWRAERDAERLQTLFGRGAASRQQLDQALAARDAARARVRAARLRAEAERAVLGNRAPVRQAEAALREAELALAHTRIVAPFDGVVGRKNVEPGAIVAPGQPLLALASSERPWVIANFKETQIRRIRLGAPAEVRVDAYPGVVWHGRVDSFAPATGSKFALLPPEPASGNFTKVVQRVPVKIVLDSGPGIDPGEGAATGSASPRLRLGLSVEASVRAR